MLLVLLALLALPSAFAIAGLGPNPADDRRLLNKPIEGFRYDRATHCRKKAA